MVRPLPLWSQGHGTDEGTDEGSEHPVRLYHLALVAPIYLAGDD